MKLRDIPFYQINTLKEMKKFYNKDSFTYIFNGDVEFTFDLELEGSIVIWNDLKAKNINLDTGNIEAQNINANNIYVGDIYAKNIEARNIEANDIRDADIVANNIVANNIMVNNIEAKHISYNAVCYAKDNIVCETIKGSHPNSKHFVLDGKLEVKNS